MQNASARGDSDLHQLPRLRALIAECGLVAGSDNVYSAPAVQPNPDQAAEVQVRERDAARQYPDYLAHIARHSSIPVMDAEVDRFLSRLPNDALVLDIGGCFGWHWRRLGASRPDVSVVIIDFVRQSLVHARTLLGSLVGSQVALVHADATALPFGDADGGATAFDGVWTVQVLEHIPRFELACREARRVLKPGGRFINYSLHATPLNRMIYRLFGRRYHMTGMTTRGEGVMYLDRASDAQSTLVGQVFGGIVEERYTECLFNIDLRVRFPGRPNSILGMLDARLSNHPWIGRWIARQRSFEVTRW